MSNLIEDTTPLPEIPLTLGVREDPEGVALRPLPDLGPDINARDIALQRLLEYRRRRPNVLARIGAGGGLQPAYGVMGPRQRHARIFLRSLLSGFNTRAKSESVENAATDKDLNAEFVATQSVLNDAERRRRDEADYQDAIKDNIRQSAEAESRAQAREDAAEDRDLSRAMREKMDEFMRYYRERGLDQADARLAAMNYYKGEYLKMRQAREGRLTAAYMRWPESMKRDYARRMHEIDLQENEKDPKRHPISHEEAQNRRDALQEEFDLRDQFLHTGFGPFNQYGGPNVQTGGWPWYVQPPMIPSTPDSTRFYNAQPENQHP